MLQQVEARRPGARCPGTGVGRKQGQSSRHSLRASPVDGGVGSSVPMVTPKTLAWVKEDNSVPTLVSCA